MTTTIPFGAHRDEVLPFRLKTFQNEGPAARAEGSLSSSFAELTSLKSLIEMDPDLLDRLTSFTGAYSGLHGSPDLKEAIAGMLGMQASEIIVTNGTDEAIDLVCASVLREGDLVSCIEPAYEPLKLLATRYGGKVVGAPLREEPDWHLERTDWDQLFPENIRIVVLNSPHNPTGWVPSENELVELIGRARSADALVLADEVYAGLSPQQSDRFPCLAARYDNVISIASFSKSFGLPGLRVGWIASRNKTLIERIKRIRTHANSFASRPAEIIAISVTRNASRILQRNAEITRIGREALAAFVERKSKLWSLSMPQQGPVALARWKGPGTASDLCRHALEELKLVIVSSDLFQYGDRHVRFGFGTSAFPSQLARFERFLETHYG